MRKRLIFFFKYFIFWLIIFIVFRLIFLLYHIHKFHHIRFIDYILIFVNGLKLDLSLTGYIAAVPALVFLLFSWFKNQFTYKVIRIYTLVLVPIVSFFCIIDLELYNYWHYRLDESVLDYINTPKEMLANLMWYHYILIPLLLFLTSYLFVKVLYNNVLKLNTNLDFNASWKVSIIFLIVFPALIIPIRGGFSTAPINVGAVYFHKETIVNHTAINPVWNLIFTLTESDNLQQKVDFFDKKHEDKLLRSLKQENNNTIKVLNTDKPNIIIIILESFTASVIEDLGGRKGVTPNISRLIKEGILFNNFYASGWSSNRGIGAILAGYPALPKTCILKYENKTETLPGLSKDLSDMGYAKRFYYGGDIDFAHIRSFLINNKFDDIISSGSFIASDYYSKWGVPDGKVFQRLLKESDNSKKPFLHVFFTLSSHEPYDVPMETVIKGNSITEMFCNSVYYTDKCLGEFIDSAKVSDWWDSTLIVMVADHGARIDDMPHYDKKRFHIPMLWIGGALNIKDTVIEKFGCQTDIAATILSQMDLNTEKYIFSRNLLSSDSLNYTSYIYPYGIAFMQDSIYVAYDLSAEKFIKKEGEPNDRQKDLAKAVIQNLLKDFSERK